MFILIILFIGLTARLNSDHLLSINVHSLFLHVKQHNQVSNKN